MNVTSAGWQVTPWVPVAVRRVANCYTLVTFTYYMYCYCYSFLSRDRQIDADTDTHGGPSEEEATSQRPKPTWDHVTTRPRRGKLTHVIYIYIYIDRTGATRSIVAIRQLRASECHSASQLEQEYWPDICPAQTSPPPPPWVSNTLSKWIYIPCLTAMVTRRCALNK